MRDTNNRRFMRAYRVTLHGKRIDTYFAQAEGRNRDERERAVRASLVNHDGYDDAIEVSEARASYDATQAAMRRNAAKRGAS